MICLDTNIVIYIAQGLLKANVFDGETVIYPSVVRIEALGYPGIKSIEERRISELLDRLTIVPLSSTIVNHAIKLRQAGKMSLGDAVVASTAIDSHSILWTANATDFRNIDGLDVYNPLKKLQ